MSNLIRWNCGVVRVGIVALLAALAIAAEPARNIPGERDGVATTTSAPTTSPALATQAVRHLIYIKWSGMSPGGGFTRTTLVCVEVDLLAGRQRSLNRLAEAPVPMLPGDKASIVGLIAKEPWLPMEPARGAQLTEAVVAWQATTPPAFYAGPMIGMEDGALEAMTIETNRGVHTTKIAFRAANQTPVAPDAWRALVRLLE